MDEIRACECGSTVLPEYEHCPECGLRRTRNDDGYVLTDGETYPF